jgi:hypothetical protein
MLALTDFRGAAAHDVSDHANSILAQKISQMPGVGLVRHRRSAEPGDAQNPAVSRFPGLAA